MIRNHVVAMALAAALTACASQSVYRPAERTGAEGYTETRLADNRYRVSFNGNSQTESGTVQDYALLRAAELTLQLGYDWFELANRDVEKKERAMTTVDGGFATPPHASVYRSCGLLTCRTTVVERPGYGTGVATTTTSARYSAQLEVVMGKYPKPESGDPYDARDVVRTLRAALIDGPG